MGAALAAAADGYQHLEVSAVGGLLQRGERPEAALRAVDLDLGVGVFIRKLHALAYGGTVDGTHGEGAVGVGPFASASIVDCRDSNT